MRVLEGDGSRARVLARTRGWRWARIEWRTRVPERHSGRKRAHLVRACRYLDQNGLSSVPVGLFDRTTALKAL